MPSSSDREAKWRRMKRHIAASARRRGKSGDEYNAYVYGAMRARGWKPKRERVHENVNARVRPTSGGTSTAHYQVHHGNRDLQFKSPEHKRPGVYKNPIPEQITVQARRWLNEVYAGDYVPYNPPESSTGKVHPAATLKKVYNVGKKEFSKEVVHPFKASKLAIKHLRTARKTAKSGHLAHARVQRRRATAVLTNRGSALAGAAVGAVVGTVTPGPSGGILMNSAMGAKAARMATVKFRPRQPKVPVTEVYAGDMVPHQLPVPMFRPVVTAKKVAKHTHKEMRREIFSPYRSVRRAVRYRQQALQMMDTNPDRAKVMLGRSQAVLKNRMPTLIAAGAAWAATPLPGTGAGEVAAVGAAKSVNKWTRKKRASDKIALTEK